MNDFYSFNLSGIDGSKDLLGKLRGKVTLAVNVASRCPHPADSSGSSSSWTVRISPWWGFRATSSTRHRGADPYVLLHELRGDVSDEQQDRGQRCAPSPPLRLAHLRGQRFSGRRVELRKFLIAGTAASSRSTADQTRGQGTAPGHRRRARDVVSRSPERVWPLLRDCASARRRAGRRPGPHEVTARCQSPEANAGS